MNDIVERLRGGTSDGLRAWDWMREAADEIEKLRAKLQKAERDLDKSRYISQYRDDGFGGSPMQYDYYGKR